MVVQKRQLPSSWMFPYIFLICQVLKWNTDVLPYWCFGTVGDMQSLINCFSANSFLICIWFSTTFEIKITTGTQRLRSTPTTVDVQSVAEPRGAGAEEWAGRSRVLAAIAIRAGVGATKFGASGVRVGSDTTSHLSLRQTWCSCYWLLCCCWLTEVTMTSSSYCFHVKFDLSTSVGRWKYVISSATRLGK